MEKILSHLSKIWPALRWNLTWVGCIHQIHHSVEISLRWDFVSSGWDEFSYINSSLFYIVGFVLTNNSKIQEHLFLNVFKTWNHNHKKQKDSLETRAVLLISSLKLEISGWSYREYIKTWKNGGFVRNFSVKMTLRLF